MGLYLYDQFNISWLQWPHSLSNELYICNVSALVGPLQFVTYYKLNFQGFFLPERNNDTSQKNKCCRVYFYLMHAHQKFILVIRISWIILKICFSTDIHWTSSLQPHLFLTNMVIKSKPVPNRYHFTIKDNLALLL